MAQAGGADGRAAGDRPGPPRQRLPRGAQADRGGAEVRPAARRGRHLQPGAGHRHGRGRPGRADRGAADGRRRAAAGRPGRAPGRRGLARRRLPQAPRRPAVLRGGRRADARRARSRSCATRATRSTCWPSRSSRWWRWTPWPVAELAALVRRAAPFAELPDSALHAVLDMLSGRYPSTAFAELRPRLVWDRATDLLTGRPGAQRLAVTSGGTIPDRGLFGVFLAGAERAVAGRRARRGDGLRVAGRRRLPARLDLLADRGHHARPGAGLPRAGRSRPGCRSGRATRRAARSSWAGRSAPGCATLVRHGDDARPAGAARRPGSTSGPPATCWPTCGEQREATRHLPDDRTVVVERFRDELGDWRMAVHCVLGAQVNAPWALAIGRRLAERYGVDAPGDAVRRRHRGAAARHRRASRPAPTWSPSTRRRSPRSSRSRSARRRCSPPGSASARPGRCCCPAATRAAASRCGSSASGRRSCSTWPASSPTSRSRWRRPASACRTSSTCPAWSALMRDLAGRKVRLVEVETPRPSPFARSLLFGYVGAFLYEGDAPLAERRAAALALDSTLLGELLGRVDLRELLDPAVVAETERQLQWLTDERRAARRRGRRPSCCGCSATCPTPSWPARGADPAWLGRAGGRPPGDPGADRRRGALDRRRGRRPGPRRARASPCRSASPEALPGAGRRPARRPGRPLRPHPRPVHRRRPAPPGSGSACSWSSRRCSGSPPTGRVVSGEFSPGRRRHRVVRRRGAAAAAPPVAGRAAPGDRAGAARGAGHVPARWQHVGASARGVEAVAAAIEQLQGVGGAGLGAGAAGAAGPGRRLLPGATSTSCAPPARWCGPAPGRCPAATAGSTLAYADTAAAAAARRPTPSWR